MDGDAVEVEVEEFRILEEGMNPEVSKAGVAVARLEGWELVAGQEEEAVVIWFTSGKFSDSSGDIADAVVVADAGADPGELLSLFLHQGLMMIIIMFNLVSSYTW